MIFTEQDWIRRFDNHEIVILEIGKKIVDLENTIVKQQQEIEILIDVIKKMAEYNKKMESGKV